ncbi:MAG: hypothetical protein QOI38_1703 [Sphingomonadales bacterium]|jgi:hypothetical protein|nr:hypothetical protein [Sphingomonadales bacterium]
MIISVALSLALAVQQEPALVLQGPWQMHCYRRGSLAGMDHELCKATMWVEQSGPGAEIERSAEGLKVTPWPGECPVDLDPAILPASAFAGRDRAGVVAAFIRTQIERALVACRSRLRAPDISERDVATLLRASDGLAPGSFVQLDPAMRAPGAAICGRQLAAAWNEAVRLHPPSDTARVGLMMYTMSEGGSRRAARRFEQLPELMGEFFSMGVGPGGSMINAEKPAASWRNAPDQWFVTLCDVAMEAWSSFVELSLYEGGRGDGPVFTVRAQTGVASPDGYVIWSGGPMPER